MTKTLTADSAKDYARVMLGESCAIVDVWGYSDDGTEFVAVEFMVDGQRDRMDVWVEVYRGFEYLYGEW